MDAPRDKGLPEVPHHVLDAKQRKLLVYVISVAALFSPLSSNIYLPSVDTISKDLHVGVSVVLLSITMYMVVQGLAPSFWGALADTAGRRPVFIGTLAVYLIANLGLALSIDFPMLMVFRGLQAFGSSATISIGAGVIADVTTPADRGGLLGIFGGVRMLGQSFGPVLGGVLTQFLGFRSIFWFLLIAGSIVLVLIILVLPETLRSITGDGTMKLTGSPGRLVFYKPVTAVITGGESSSISERNVDSVSWKLTWRALIGPLSSLFERDVFVSLFFGSVVYTAWSMVTASTTPLFKTTYHLNNLEVGLAFLPNGLGCIAGSIVTGKFMDYNYKKTVKEYRKTHKIPATIEINRKELQDFPVEHARLRRMWLIVIVFIATVTLFGFSLSTDIDLPLALQFLISASATSIFNINSALIIDLYPGKSASATATNNLARCSLGAVGVALADPLIDLAGPRIAFVILAGLTLLASPLVWIEWRWGMRWRKERLNRIKDRKGEETVPKNQTSQDLEMGRIRREDSAPLQHLSIPPLAFSSSPILRNHPEESYASPTKRNYSA